MWRSIASLNRILNKGQRSSTDLYGGDLRAEVLAVQRGDLDADRVRVDGFEHSHERHVVLGGIGQGLGLGYW